MVGERALVLGSGGITGIAWELGMLLGLADAGVDLRDADLVVGTSAGSVVASQLTNGVPLALMYEAQLSGHHGEFAARFGLATMARLGWAMVSSRDAQGSLARIGAMARATATGPEAERRAVIESRLAARDWPQRPLVITAVDAESGAFTVFDRRSGVSLVDAVAASCAVPGVWPPVSIDGRRYMDGGMRSPVNADLAAGAARVVVLAPIVRGSRHARLRDQMALLRRRARVTVVSPDRPARRAIGRNMLDPARRAAAARAGWAQAASASAAVAAVWSD